MVCCSQSSDSSQLCFYKPILQPLFAVCALLDTSLIDKTAPFLLRISEASTALIVLLRKLTSSSALFLLNAIVESTSFKTSHLLTRYPTYESHRPAPIDCSAPLSFPDFVAVSCSALSNYPTYPPVSLTALPLSFTKMSTLNKACSLWYFASDIYLLDAKAKLSHQVSSHPAHTNFRGFSSHLQYLSHDLGS